MDQATNPSTIFRAPIHRHVERAFIDQLVNIDQSSSLIDYVNRFKTADTVIFADVDELEVHAVIDYHAAGSIKSGFAEHRAVLSLAHSHQWDTWNTVSGRMHDQKSFARLLNVNSEDVASPSAAALRQAVLGLDAATDSLPSLVTLIIPVFAGEPSVEVKAITDHQNNAGKISVGLELVRTRLIAGAEITRIANAIASATSVPVILGSIRD